MSNDPSIDGIGDDPRPLYTRIPSAHDAERIIAAAMDEATAAAHADAARLAMTLDKAILAHTRAAHEAVLLLHAFLLARDLDADADAVASAGRTLERLNHEAITRIRKAANRRTR